MFRCLDTGLDNSHQCLKKQKDIVSIKDSKKYRTRSSIYFTDYYLPVTSVTQYPFEAEDW